MARIGGCRGGKARLWMMSRSFRFRQYPVERNHFSAAQAVFGTAARTWSFWPRSSCILTWLHVGIRWGAAGTPRSHLLPYDLADRGLKKDGVQPPLGHGL